MLLLQAAALGSLVGCLSFAAQAQQPLTTADAVIGPPIHKAIASKEPEDPFLQSQKERAPDQTPSNDPPLTEKAAVHIALASHPQLQSRLMTLGAENAEQLLRLTVPQPPTWLDDPTHRAATDEKEPPHSLSSSSKEALRVAQDILVLSAETRRAWLRAVAAQQVAGVRERMHESAQIGAELAKRMASIGNWSRLQHAHERAVLTDSAQQLAQTRLAVAVEREQLNRRLGMWGMQTPYTLPSRLPEMPSFPRSPNGLEAQALRDRLDLRTAQIPMDTDAPRDKHIAQLPAALLARSEVRIAWLTYHTLYGVAQQQRDQVVPLHEFIREETLLRYNGMLTSVWDLLAQARGASQAVSNAILAQRDFWLADTDMQLSLLTGLPSTPPVLFSGSTAAIKKPDH